jgi:hypothetical protein
MTLRRNGLTEEKSVMKKSVIRSEAKNPAFVFLSLPFSPNQSQFQPHSGSPAESVAQLSV